MAACNTPAKYATTTVKKNRNRMTRTHRPIALKIIPAPKQILSRLVCCSRYVLAMSLHQRMLKEQTTVASSRMTVPVTDRIVIQMLNLSKLSIPITSSSSSSPPVVFTTYTRISVTSSNRKTHSSVKTRLYNKNSAFSLSGFPEK